jgi:23S rRNA pseudouridine1911/1915/1917 synthase
MNKLNSTVPEEMAGERLDKVLAQLFPQHSRARLQEWIKMGNVQVDNKSLKQKVAVQAGQIIEIIPVFEPQVDDAAEDIPLSILHEDEALIIINKPAGMVVHPGAGNAQHTLLNALLHFDPGLEDVPRAGIIQRLDKDTSGIMIIARQPSSHTYLVEELRQRRISRQYEAIVHGVMTAGGTINAAIARHSRQRKQMTVAAHGKEAITHYRVANKFRAHTHIRVNLETGRTHQIRVHMAHIKYPIVGDPVYGGRKRSAKNISDDLRRHLESFPRQALHATKLELEHPLRKEKVEYYAPLPEDISQLLETLSIDTKNG